MTPGTVLQFGTLLGGALCLYADHIGGRSALVKKPISGIYREFRKGLPPLPPRARWLHRAGMLVFVASTIYWIVS
jgi:hypothetical protein